MTKQTGKDPLPYVIIGTGREQNLRFYTGYDEHFHFNKVASFLYILDEGEPAVQQIEERLTAHGGAKLPERYLESIRAEVFLPLFSNAKPFSHYSLPRSSRCHTGFT